MKIGNDPGLFWGKVDQSGGSDGCWPWTGYCDLNNGYGQVHVIRDGRDSVTTAHRLAYEFATGDLLGERMADHTCFNHPCCNPAHLRPATRKQNGENRQGARCDNKTSGVLGVSWHKGSRGWQAKVKHEGRWHWVGRFETVEEAGEAVRLKRIELYTHNDVDRGVARSSSSVL